VSALPAVGLVMVLSYLAGSIPTSLLMGRLLFGKDVRDHGSGSAGGTNAFRVFGWKAGLPTVIVDVGKGLVATLFLSRLAADAPVPRELVQVLAGCSAVVGHIWTVFARFRGGKGVATAAGMVAALYPVPLAISAAVFAAVVFATGIVSLASIVTAAAFPVVLAVLNATGLVTVPPVLFWFSLPLAGLIVFAHRSNIRRLVAGSENRFPKLMVFSRLLRRVRGAGRQHAGGSGGQADPGTTPPAAGRPRGGTVDGRKGRAGLPARRRRG
jgi:glycerol-3-phosphate acyltransferase PlsY